MHTAAAKQTAIVTKDELKEIAELEQDSAKAEKKARDLKKQLEFQRLRLAEKVLGVKSAEELKKLSPKDVEKLYARRLTAGDWKPERSAPAFVFLKTSEGRYPAWKQLYVDLAGETAAAEISANTNPIYSYAVQVAAQ
jgi:hypothetical protein